MKKNTKSRKISDAKRKKHPKIRFNFMILIIIFVLSFAACFALYMVAANLDDNFFPEEEGSAVTAPESPESPTVSTTEEATAATGGSDAPADVIINPVPQSAAVDASYLESCCLITDSTLLMLAENTAFKDVIGSAELNVAGVNSVKIPTPYGTVTPYEAAKLKKPMNLYIMIGSDVGTSDTSEMIAEYSRFVTNLKSALPDTKIYIMQLPPIASNVGVKTNAAIDDYNSQLLALAKSSGVYCLDTNTDFKSNEGTLRADYIGENSSDLTSDYYNDICGYILTHTT